MHLQSSANPRVFRHVFTSVLCIALLLAAGQAQTFTVLHNFGGAGDGYDPEGGLVMDKKGNLYGVTFEGGARGYGMAYQLVPNGDGTWTENDIYDFGSQAGALPDTTLAFDHKGNIYGGTFDGTIFELIPNNGKWSAVTITSLVNGEPGAVVFDPVDTLYSPVTGNGRYQQGTLLTPSRLNQYSTVILYTFTGGQDGGTPNGPLVFGSSGNLYGTARQGGLNVGNVFKLTPNRGQPGWHETTLYSFQGSPNDGANPYAGVVFDTVGNLYGTTLNGGSAGLGTVFELSPNSDGTWSETVLHEFQGGSDGSYPIGPVTLDTSGNLYGTTDDGGPNNAGTVYKLSPSSGGKWTETILHTFTGGSDGSGPTGALVLDNAGNLFGATGFAGSNGGGTAFEITP